MGVKHFSILAIVAECAENVQTSIGIHLRRKVLKLCIFYRNPMRFFHKDFFSAQVDVFLKTLKIRPYCCLSVANVHPKTTNAYFLTNLSLK